MRDEELPPSSLILDIDLNGEDDFGNPDDHKQDSEDDRARDAQKSRASLGPWPLDEIADALTQVYFNVRPPRLPKNPPYISPPLSR